MTCVNIEQERELFEAFASDNGKWLKSIERDANGNYLLLTTNFGWMWWQAARRAPAAPVPPGWKLVPVELLERIQESLGSFVSDQGWSQSDIDTADALDGLLAAAPQLGMDAEYQRGYQHGYNRRDAEVKGALA